MSEDVVGIPNEVLGMQMKKEKRRLTAQQWRKDRKTEVEVLKQRVADLEGGEELEAMRESSEQTMEQLGVALARQRELQDELEEVVEQRNTAIRERDEARRERDELEEELDAMLKDVGKS